MAPKLIASRGVFKQLMMEELSGRTGIKVEDLKTYVQTHAPIQQHASLALKTQRLMPNTPGPMNHSRNPTMPLVSKNPVGLHRVKIRLTPINHLTALLINHPELADHVDSTELLEVAPTKIHCMAFA